MKTFTAYFIIVVTVLIAVQSAEEVWNLAYPVCEKLQKYLINDECTHKQQYSNILVAPNHELDEVLKRKHKKHADPLPTKQEPLNLNDDDTEDPSIITQFLQGLYAQDACENLSDKGNQQELGAQFKKYGCSVRKTVNKVGITTQEAFKGLHAAFLQDECQKDTAGKAQDIKTSFQNVGCLIRKSASELKEAAQPWAEQVIFTTKEASTGLFDAFTQTNCEDLPKTDDAAIKSWFQDAGCKFRRGAEDLGQTAAEKIGATTTHINNIVTEKYQTYKAKFYKKSWSEKATDSLHNMGAIVADKYSVLKQAIGIEDVTKDSTWLEKLQQKLEALKKTVNL